MKLRIVTTGLIDNFPQFRWSSFVCPRLRHDAQWLYRIYISRYYEMHAKTTLMLVQQFKLP